MKKLLPILIVALSSLSYSQEVNSTNFKKKLAGIWTLNFYDASWNVEEWMCVDTLTFLEDGTINSVRTCERPQDYPEDEFYDPIMRSKDRWTRFEEKEMKIYGQYFQEWDNTWDEESEYYRVISITESEIRVETDAYSESGSEPEVLRVIYRRVE